MDVLEPAVRGVVQGQARLARQPVLQAKAAVDGARAPQVETARDVVRGEPRPTALHLDAAEALLGDREQGAPPFVDHHDAGLVTAVKSYQHGAPT